MFRKILGAIGIFVAFFIFLAIILPTPPETEITSTEIAVSVNTEPEVAETEAEDVIQEEKKEEQEIPVSNPIVEQEYTEPEKPTVQKTTNPLYEVVSVVDGDTVKLNIDGTTETIRLIGIDTPETVHPTKPVECFGIEASNKAKQLLSGQTVSFEMDASQGTRDKYGRLLGYIILSNGSNFNELMIEQGYAYEYTYSIPYKYQADFKAAEQYARANGIGLWADGVCEEESYQDNTPAATSGGKWYVSSHYSSKYYHCEESDGWKSLSEKYLKVYDSEAALLADFPNHTLHESCQ